jgi:hypothetical protein
VKVEANPDSCRHYYYSQEPAIIARQACGGQAQAASDKSVTISLREFGEVNQSPNEKGEVEGLAHGSGLQVNQVRIRSEQNCGSPRSQLC